MTGAFSRNNLPHNTAENIITALASVFTKSAPHADNTPNELETDAFSIRQKYSRMPSSTNSASVYADKYFFIIYIVGLQNKNHKCT